MTQLQTKQVPVFPTPFPPPPAHGDLCYYIFSLESNASDFISFPQHVSHFVMSSLYPPLLSTPSSPGSHTLREPCRRVCGLFQPPFLTSSQKVCVFESYAMFCFGCSSPINSIAPRISSCLCFSFSTVVFGQTALLYVSPAHYSRLSHSFLPRVDTTST